MPFALPEALFFTGIDWAAQTHAVCVTDAGGTITAEFTIRHSADGIALLIRRLARHGEAGVMPVTIERPDGRLAGLLLEAGHPVVPVSPNAVRTWRGDARQAYDGPGSVAANSRHASPWAAKIYSDARARGKDHPHAIRILARAWIRVIWRGRLDGAPYDPAQHDPAQHDPAQHDPAQHDPAALAGQPAKQIAA